MTDYTFMTYISKNYVTLLLIAAFITVLIANRKMKIMGLKYVQAIIAVVFVLTLCEALEDMCDAYNWDIRLLYLKTAMVYWLYPLTALLELLLVMPVKSKLLLLIPYLINFVLVFIDLFDTHIIYYFRNDHSYAGGPLSSLPVIVLCIYVVLLGFYSAECIGNRSFSKGLFAGFMTLSTLITALGESKNVFHGYSETVTMIEILVYYIFLSSISYSQTQKKLYESRIQLEQDRLKLLTAQIQPHFIFNSLSTLQALCYTDSEAAAECISVFGDYLRANIDSLSSNEPIPFSAELDHIRQYIRLEEAGTDVHFEVVFDTEAKDFSVPPLTVQPIVENAIKHGALTRRDGTGRVTIRTEESNGKIVITVTDNGTGVKLTEKQSRHYSVGMENARKRLEVQCGGTLDISFTEKGGTAVITIPKTVQ